MRIGCDHFASTTYRRSILDPLSTDDLAEEITRTLTSTVGLVLAAPGRAAVQWRASSPTASLSRAAAAASSGSFCPRESISAASASAITLSFS